MSVCGVRPCSKAIAAFKGINMSCRFPKLKSGPDMVLATIVAAKTISHTSTLVTSDRRHHAANPPIA